MPQPWEESSSGKLESSDLTRLDNLHHKVWQCLGHWGGGEKATKEGLVASTRKEWQGLRSRPLLSCYPLQRGPATGASTPWI